MYKQLFSYLRVNTHSASYAGNIIILFTEVTDICCGSQSSRLGKCRKSRNYVSGVGHFFVEVSE
jgi:hypothetical protein